MTIRDVAEMTGLSVQAVYKRLKTAKIELSTIKDAKTGHFTPDGEAEILTLFNAESKPVVKNAADSTEVVNLQKRVAELETEVEGLQKQLSTVESERDYLRTALANAQQLQAMTLSKFALPAPETERKGRFRSWLERKRTTKNRPEPQDVVD